METPLKQRLWHPRWLLHFNVMSTMMTWGLWRGMDCYTFFKFLVPRNKITSSSGTLSLAQSHIVPCSQVAHNTDNKTQVLIVAGTDSLANLPSRSQKLGRRSSLEPRWKWPSRYLPTTGTMLSSLMPEVAVSSGIWRNCLSFASEPMKVSLWLWQTTTHLRWRWIYYISSSYHCLHM